MCVNTCGWKVWYELFCLYVIWGNSWWTVPSRDPLQYVRVFWEARRDLTGELWFVLRWKCDYCGNDRERRESVFRGALQRKPGGERRHNFWIIFWRELLNGNGQWARVESQENNPSSRSEGKWRVVSRSKPKLVDNISCTILSKFINFSSCFNNVLPPTHPAIMLYIYFTLV